MYEKYIRMSDEQFAQWQLGYIQKRPIKYPWDVVRIVSTIENATNARLPKKGKQRDK